MQHAVAREMHLIRLTEQGVYEKLLRLLDRHQNGDDGGDGGRGGQARVVFEMGDTRKRGRECYL